MGCCRSYGMLLVLWDVVCLMGRDAVGLIRDGMNLILWDDVGLIL